MRSMAYRRLAFILAEVFDEYLRDSRDLGICPRLKATKGAEVIMLDGA